MPMNNSSSNNSKLSMTEKRELWPTYDLAYSIDRMPSGTRIVVFPRTASTGLLTKWLSIDEKSAVSLEKCQ